MCVVILIRTRVLHNTHGYNSNPIRIIMLLMLLYGLAYIYTRNVCTSVCKLKCIKGAQPCINIITLTYITPTWPVNIYNHCHGSSLLKNPSNSILHHLFFGIVQVRNIHHNWWFTVCSINAIEPNKRIKEGINPWFCVPFFFNVWKLKHLWLDLRSWGQFLAWTTTRDTHLSYGQDPTVGGREDATLSSLTL